MQWIVKYSCGKHFLGGRRSVWSALKSYLPTVRSLEEDLSKQMAQHDKVEETLEAVEGELEEGPLRILGYFARIGRLVGTALGKGSR